MEEKKIYAIEFTEYSEETGETPRGDYWNGVSVLDSEFMEMTTKNIHEALTFETKEEANACVVLNPELQVVVTEHILTHSNKG